MMQISNRDFEDIRRLVSVCAERADRSDLRWYNLIRRAAKAVKSADRRTAARREVQK